MPIKSTIQYDLSRIEGSLRYCSKEAEEAVSALVRARPRGGVHYLGSGDYHYISYLRMKCLQEPFLLVLLDNHPDDQAGAFDSSTLSCGNWVMEARKNLPMMKSDIWIQSAADTEAAVEKAGQFPGLPLFLSVDLDVLSTRYFRTGWNQGKMTPQELEDSISALCRGRRIIGTDLCGALPEGIPALSCDCAMNEAVISRISAFLSLIK